MEPLLFVMAILGCGESDSACRELRIEPVRYSREADCLAATETALMRADDLDFPNIVAQCRPANRQPQLLRGSDVLRPAGGTLPAQVRFASGRVRL
jgi:hypothetical protein